jgi:hypothetical protein
MMIRQNKRKPCPLIFVATGMLPEKYPAPAFCCPVIWLEGKKVTKYKIGVLSFS